MHGHKHGEGLWRPTDQQTQVHGKGAPVEDVVQRLAAVENRLDRLESLLRDIAGKLESRPAEPAPEAIESLKHWVTDFVALRLQQLVPRKRAFNTCHGRRGRTLS